VRASCVSRDAEARSEVMGRGRAAARTTPGGGLRNDAVETPAARAGPYTIGESSASVDTAGHVSDHVVHAQPGGQEPPHSQGSGPTPSDQVGTDRREPDPRPHAVRAVKSGHQLRPPAVLRRELLQDTPPLHLRAPEHHRLLLTRRLTLTRPLL